MNGSEQSARLPFTISVCSLFAVDKYRASGITHLLSIDDPGNSTPTPKWFKGTHWHLAFDDVESSVEARQLSATEPTREDVRSILDHASDCLAASRSSPVHLLVHCVAGISRSTGAAFAIMSSLLGPGHETNAFRLLLAIQPDAFPNRLVVKHADEIMERRGLMLKALDNLREKARLEAEEWIRTFESRSHGTTGQET